MSYQLQGELKTWHEAVVDWMISNPTGTLEDCARHFSKSYNWMSTLTRTDAFKEYKARRLQSHQERLSEIIHSRVTAVAEKALDTIEHRIDRERDNISLDFLHDTAELSLSMLGYGPKAHAAKNPHVVNLNFGVSPEVLAKAREDMRRVQAGNTREAEDAEVVEDVTPAIAAPGE